MSDSRIAVIFDNFGPYHVARLSAAAQCCTLLGIEVTSVSDEYQWQQTESLNFERKTLFRVDQGEGKDQIELGMRLVAILSAYRPEVVVIPGWAFSEAAIALHWAVKQGVPVVLMSDSQEIDFSRTAIKEWIKRRYLRLCQAALVGGVPHKAYLEKLGMPGDRIFTGYDVVDNTYFATRAEQARKNKKHIRKELLLPQHYFLATSRFVEKKNIPRLFKAYSIYRQRAGAEAWGLVLLGDGPLRDEVFQRRQNMGLEHSVILPGFKQHHELPLYYGLADVFVQASTTEQWGLVVNEAMACGLPVIVSERCGCAADLVEEGRNGHTFDPYDVEALTDLMCKFSENEDMRKNMGRESLNIIDHWSLDTFTEGLLNAAEVALKTPRLPLRLYDQGLLELLISR